MHLGAGGEDGDVALLVAAGAADRRRGRRDSRPYARSRRVGSSCRVSASTDGPSAWRSASSQHSGRLDRVGRAEHQHVRDRAQARQMLDRLVRRAVLAEADRIVRGDEDHPLPHQRRQPQRRPAIVGEHQEGAAIGDDAAMHRHAVHGGDHGVLAHAVADVAAAILAGRDRLGRRRCWSGWSG